VGALPARRHCRGRAGAGCDVRSALSFAEIIPFLSTEGTSGFCRLVLSVRASKPSQIGQNRTAPS
jgi:hypothetical protein